MNQRCRKQIKGLGSGSLNKEIHTTDSARQWYIFYPKKFLMLYCRLLNRGKSGNTCNQNHVDLISKIWNNQIYKLPVVKFRNNDVSYIDNYIKLHIT